MVLLLISIFLMLPGQIGPQIPKHTVAASTLPSKRATVGGKRLPDMESQCCHWGTVIRHDLYTDGEPRLVISRNAWLHGTGESVGR